MATNNISRVPSEELLSGGLTDSLKKNVVLRQEQKSVDWKICLVSKLCNDGELVLDICAGAFAAARVCLQLPEHRRVVGCEKCSACF